LINTKFLSEGENTYGNGLATLELIISNSVVVNTSV